MIPRSYSSHAVSVPLGGAAGGGPSASSAGGGKPSRERSPDRDRTLERHVRQVRGGVRLRGLAGGGESDFAEVRCAVADCEDAGEKVGIAIFFLEVCISAVLWSR